MKKLTNFLIMFVVVTSIFSCEKIKQVEIIKEVIIKDTVTVTETDTIEKTDTLLLDKDYPISLSLKADKASFLVLDSRNLSLQITEDVTTEYVMTIEWSFPKAVYFKSYPEDPYMPPSSVFYAYNRVGEISTYFNTQEVLDDKVIFSSNSDNAMRFDKPTIVGRYTSVMKIYKKESYDKDNSIAPLFVINDAFEVTSPPIEVRFYCKDLAPYLDDHYNPSESEIVDKLNAAFSYNPLSPELEGLEMSKMYTVITPQEGRPTQTTASRGEMLFHVYQEGNTDFFMNVDETNTLVTDLYEEDDQYPLRWYINGSDYYLSDGGVCDGQPSPPYDYINADPLQGGFGCLMSDIMTNPNGDPNTFTFNFTDKWCGKHTAFISYHLLPLGTDLNNLPSNLTMCPEYREWWYEKRIR